jgi:hypothetical protein
MISLTDRNGATHSNFCSWSSPDSPLVEIAATQLTLDYQHQYQVTGEHFEFLYTR